MGNLLASNPPNYFKVKPRYHIIILVDIFKYVFFFNLFIYFWLCWVLASARGPSPAAASGGPLFIAVRGPLTIAAPPVAEHRLQTRRLSSCSPRAQLLRGMWDPPRPGLEPVSPASAGRFPTTAPPGKPPKYVFLKDEKITLFFFFYHKQDLKSITTPLKFNSLISDIPSGFRISPHIS